jgi:hypothetical protein
VKRRGPSGLRCAVVCCGGFDSDADASSFSLACLGLRITSS